MAKRGYRSVLFLKGHLLRRSERFDEAVAVLEEAIRERKYKRSAIHELALALKISGKLDRLRRLLSEHSDMIERNAMFADFQIGIDLARGDLQAAEAGIRRLRLMSDDEGKSDIREAQLLIKSHRYREATVSLSNLLQHNAKRRFHIRSLRAIAAAKGGNFELAEQDLKFVKSIPGRELDALRLRIVILSEMRKVEEAEGLLETIVAKRPEDWLLRARILELKAEDPELGMAERNTIKQEEAEIKVRFNFALEYDYDD